MVETSTVPGEPSGDRGEEGFAERLRRVIRAYGSANSLAKAAGVSEGALRKWVGGNSEPSRDRIVAIAKAAGVNVGWLAAGQGPEKATGGEADVPEGYVAIPMLGEEADGAMGDVAFRGTWIHRELGCDAATLAMAVVRGDAMDPMLDEGDRVLVDKSQAGPTSDGVYVLDVDGAVQLRRLQRLPGNEIQASSANAAYSPFRFAPQDASVSVIGRVVWVGKEL